MENSQIYTEHLLHTGVATTAWGLYQAVQDTLPTTATVSAEAKHCTLAPASFEGAYQSRKVRGHQDPSYNYYLNPGARDRAGMEGT